MAPDVTVSTNLGPWVNRRQIFSRRDRPDTFRDEDVTSVQRWTMSPVGKHVELGIAENNLFLLLAALGLSSELFGAGLLPLAVLVAGSWLLTGFCILIMIGSVHLGWHYAIDGYVSVLAVIAIWKAVGWALRFHPSFAWTKDGRAEAEIPAAAATR